MPISDFLDQKWESKLQNWMQWLAGNGRIGGNGAKISSIYRPELTQRSSNRGPTSAVLSGEAMDTDRLMVQLASETAWQNVHTALVEWTLNKGTRGAQASRLSIHQDTYRDRVDSGKRELERRSRFR